MKKKDVIKKLKELNIAKEKFIVIDDASLVIQDFIKETEEIKLSTTPDVFERLDWPFIDNKLFADEKVEDPFIVTCSFYDKENTILKNGYSIMNIEKVYEMKNELKLKKDIKIIKELDLMLCSKDNYRYERKLRKSGINFIAGVDEVGRGPLAGPVVASCVVLPEKFDLEGLTESKKLSKKKREYFYEEIKKQALGVGVGIVSEKVIDEINIYEATKLAMKKAIEECQKKVNIEHVLTDAMALDLNIDVTPIIKGDIKSVTISAASVIAKVTRDNIMLELDKIYPMYDFKNNMGYGTKKHVEAIKKYGIIKEHRKSYHPVDEYKEKINTNIDKGRKN